MPTHYYVAIHGSTGTYDLCVAGSIAWRYKGYVWKWTVVDYFRLCRVVCFVIFTEVIFNTIKYLGRLGLVSEVFNVVDLSILILHYNIYKN